MSAINKSNKPLPDPDKSMPLRCTVIFDVSVEELHNAMEAVIEAARMYGHPRRAIADGVPSTLEFDT